MQSKYSPTIIPDMENQNDDVDQNQENSTTTANLLERSAELKRKNVEVASSKAECEIQKF